MGNKKAKHAWDEVRAMERLQSSIDKCIASVATNNAAREEKCDAWWAMIFEKQEVKIGLIKTNVTSIKREEDLALLTTDTSLMCTEVKVHYKAQVRPHCGRDEVTSGELKPHADDGPTQGTNRRSTNQRKGRRSGGGVCHLNSLL
jgi:hypothetical protein